MSELLANLALGFSVAASPYNIGFCLLGALVGTLVGVLPGIGTVATVEEQTLLLKIAENTKIRISKSAIGGPVGADGTPSESS